MAKLSEKTEATSIAGTDIAHVVLDPDGTPASRKVQYANIIASLAAVIKAAYEGEDDTNAFTDAEKAIVAGVTAALAGKQPLATVLTNTTAAFTIALLNKLNALDDEHFKGVYVDLSALNTAHATANPGDYAFVDAGVGNPPEQYVWDSSDDEWVSIGSTGSETPASILSKLLANADTNVVTDAEKAKIAATPEEFTALDAHLAANLITEFVVGDLVLVARPGGSTPAEKYKGMNTAVLTALLAGGIDYTPFDLETLDSGIVTPDFANGLFQFGVSDGATEIAPPTGNGRMVLQIRNGASAVAMSVAGFDKITGAFTNVENKYFLADIIKHSDVSSIEIVEMTTEYVPPAAATGAYSGYSTIGTIQGAWGLRLLRTGYAGALVRIRDTNDNSEQDVGFNSTTGNLDSFSVVGEARIVRFYDQSDNGNHLGQATAGNQAKLLPAGSVDGEAVADFSDGDNFYVDETPAGTAIEYMVGNPVWAGYFQRVSTGAGRVVAAIPHSDAAHTSPYFRTLVGQSATGSLSLIAANGQINEFTKSLGANDGAAFLLICGASPAEYHVNAAGATTTAYTPPTAYPNNTRLRLGSNAAAGEVFDGKFGELVIGDGGTTLDGTDRDALLAETSTFYGV